MSKWDEGLGKTVIDLRLEDGWVTKAMDYTKEVMSQDAIANDEEEIIIGVAAMVSGMAARVVNEFDDAEHHEHVLVSILGIWDLPEAARTAAIRRVYDMGQEINDLAESVIAASGN